MKTKADYASAFRIVSGAVAEWDPCSLIEGGAPRNEFDDEVARVVSGITKAKNEREAAELIAAVFSRAFDGSFTADSCSGVAGVIFSRLRDAGLLGR